MLKNKSFVFNIKIFFVVLGIILLIAAIVALKTKSPPSPTQIPPITVPNTKTVIGKTTDAQVQNKTDVINEKKNSNGSTIYTVKSVAPIFPDTIITKNGVVIYEDTNTMAETFPKVQDFIVQLGQPQEKITGSRKFGSQAVFYIYADKGVVFIANPYTNNIYAFQRFTPMSVDQYLKLYGGDIRTGSPPGM